MNKIEFKKMVIDSKDYFVFTGTIDFLVEVYGIFHNFLIEKSKFIINFSIEFLQSTFDPYKQNIIGLQVDSISPENIKGKIQLDDFYELLRQEKDRRNVKIF